LTSGPARTATAFTIVSVICHQSPKGIKFISSG
jgi:hypothetical protein